MHEECLGKLIIVITEKVVRKQDESWMNPYNFCIRSTHFWNVLSAV